jgi:hypothetical protein
MRTKVAVSSVIDGGRKLVEVEVQAVIKYVLLLAHCTVFKRLCITIIL